MLTPKFFVELLRKNQVDFFTGVPDSLLKNICAYITDHIPAQNNIIAANEGSAIGLATGHYLATQRIPLVYLQNSGIGNTVNPLLSLVDKEVYHIPMILLIGWRGEPGIKDEPQHIKQGKVTLPLLEAMGIKYSILSSDETHGEKQLHEALTHIREYGTPFAFVVRKDTFSEYKLNKETTSEYCLTREEAIQLVASYIEEKDVVVSTTGMISRELFEYREFKKQSHEKDFLTVGSMGHASQIALGIALEKKDRKVYCFDGDGAIIMHLGALAITGSIKPENYIHIVLNNGAHDSVGGQPTVGQKINLPQIALACGYHTAWSVNDKEALIQSLNDIKSVKLPILLEINIKKGARKNLGRPTTTPIENKESFMHFLK